MLTNPPLLLDTDLVSAFAWVKRMDILESLYSGNMKIPQEVLTELARVPHLKAAVDSRTANHIEVISLNPIGQDGLEFAKLYSTGKYGLGESAVMAYVRYNGGTVSSNNIKDVLEYCRDNSLSLLSTRAIIFDAVTSGVITEPEAEGVWAGMIRKGRKLPCRTVAEVMQFYTSGDGSTFTSQRY
jgi:hypothetical protein